MNEANAGSSAAGPAAPAQAPPRRELSGEGWSRKRWLTSVALVFAAQLALIFALGGKHFPSTLALKNVPQLALADGSSELIALDDPTLFALPHVNDFAPAAWGQMPIAPQPSFRWTEPPLPLPLAAENLGAVFTRFMHTNLFAVRTYDFKPMSKLSEPVLSLPPVFAENSTLQIHGELAQRRLLTPVDLPSLPYPDVLAPSRVQALADAEGNVVNAVLLPSENPIESLGRADKGDTNALRIARSLRFSPSLRPTLGELIFNWHTVPVAETNAP